MWVDVELISVGASTRWHLGRGFRPIGHSCTAAPCRRGRYEAAAALYHVGPYAGDPWGPQLKDRIGDKLLFRKKQRRRMLLMAIVPVQIAVRFVDGDHVLDVLV